MSQSFLLVFDFQVWTWCNILVSTLVSVQLQLPLIRIQFVRHVLRLAISGTSCEAIFTTGVHISVYVQSWKLWRIPTLGSEYVSFIPISALKPAEWVSEDDKNIFLKKTYLVFHHPNGNVWPRKQLEMWTIVDFPFFHTRNLPVRLASGLDTSVSARWESGIYPWWKNQLGSRLFDMVTQRNRCWKGNPFLDFPNEATIYKFWKSKKLRIVQKVW